MVSSKLIFAIAVQLVLQAINIICFLKTRIMHYLYRFMNRLCSRSTGQLKWYNPDYSRSNTFSRSLRYAKARVTRLSKRMARSADDLSKLSYDPRNVSDQTQIQGLVRYFVRF